MDPPSLPIAWVRADQDHWHVGGHPVVDVAVVAQEPELFGVFAGERSFASLRLNQHAPVAHIARRWVAQLDAAVDSGIDPALHPLMPHIGDEHVDERDAAVTDVLALADPLRTPNHPLTS